MATLIPVVGEMQMLSPPQSLAQVDALIEKSVPKYTRCTWVTTECVYVFHGQDLEPILSEGELVNPRASRFLADNGWMSRVTGSVLVLSQSEWETVQRADDSKITTRFQQQSDGSFTPLLNGGFQPSSVSSLSVPKFLPVHGNTYPVKEKLRALGGHWDERARVWNVPESRWAEANAIVKAETPPPAPKAAPPFRGKSRTYQATGQNQAGPHQPKINVHPGRCRKCGTRLDIGAGIVIWDGRWVLECSLADESRCESIVKGSTSASTNSPTLVSDYEIHVTSKSEGLTKTVCGLVVSHLAFTLESTDGGREFSSAKMKDGTIVYRQIDVNLHLNDAVSYFVPHPLAVEAWEAFGRGNKIGIEEAREWLRLNRGKPGTEIYTYLAMPPAWEIEDT